MSQPHTTTSEAELIAWLLGRHEQAALRVIGVDGANGTGKSSLARRLGAALDCPVVECDLFIRNRALAYPDILDLKCLGAVVSAAADRGAPVFVDSVLLQLVLAALGLTASCNIYVRHSWPKGLLTHQELFDPARTENELISEENELCRAAGISDEKPILARELIHYHKQQKPHEHANLLFEASFADMAL